MLAMLWGAWGFYPCLTLPLSYNPNQCDEYMYLSYPICCIFIPVEKAWWYIPFLTFIHGFVLPNLVKTQRMVLVVLDRPGIPCPHCWLESAYSLDILFMDIKYRSQSMYSIQEWRICPVCALPDRLQVSLVFSSLWYVEGRVLRWVVVAGGLDTEPLSRAGCCGLLVLNNCFFVLFLV